MSGISQSSLRALGCIRLRARTPFGLRRASAAHRQYAQLAPKLDHEELESQESESLEQSASLQEGLRERYGREFVRRHLQELDRARRAEYREEHRGQEAPPVKKANSSPSTVTLRRVGDSSRSADTRLPRRNPPISSPKEETKIGHLLPSASGLSATGRSTTISPKDPLGSSDKFMQELSSILASQSALANPSAALVRALAHHREHVSLSSTNSFNILLSYAARISNYHVMRKILREMQRGNVHWDEDTRKIVMQATLRGSGSGGGTSARSETPRETPSPQAKLPPVARQLGPPKDGNDSLPALKRRLDASVSSVTDEYRQIVLNAGYWQSEKPPRSFDQRSTESPRLGSLSIDAGKAPATRISILQDALSPAMARSHLPPLDVQLSPTLFLAFLRYILASNPQPPSLADSYAALIALDRPDREISSKHLTHLVHLYLHPSLYASFRPFWVIREMQRLSKDGSVIFTPTSETLEKALLSLRLRRNRARLATDLVDYFRRKWGDEIVSIACWRLLGRYGLEGNNTMAQELATSGGQEALARQIEHDAQHTKDVSQNVTEAMPADMMSVKVDLFPGHGLDRRKWGRVRQSIVRSQRRARRAEARAQAGAVDLPSESDAQ